MLPWPSKPPSIPSILPKLPSVRVTVTAPFSPARWFEEQRREWERRWGDDPKEQAARKEELAQYVFCDRWADS